MKELTRQELVEVNVAIIKDIHDFCIANKIKYSLGYGTLLGAVRHSGFIPWDDDADLIMPRPDYERFIKSYKSNRYTLLSCELTDYDLPFARVSDETTYKEESSTVWRDTGIAVDIYPIDGKNKLGNKFLDIRIKLIKTALRIKGTVAWKHDRGFLKNILMCILKFFTIPLSLPLLSRKLDKVVQYYDYNLSDFVGSYLSPYGYKDMYSKSCFEKYINIKFESEEFKCIADYNQYLTNIYGDYMTPPDVHHRISEHDAKFYKK